MIPHDKLRELSVDTLRALNTAVCAELRHRSARRQREAMAEYRVGEEVEFDDKRGRPTRATVLAFNRKTMTIREVGNPLQRWRISPTLVRPAPKSGS
jgi:post-segregation antitoxin (ccd killing protein)